MTTPVRRTPASVVMVEVAGQQVPLKSQPSCHTCQSPYRLEIEQMICSGSSYQVAAETVADRPAGRFPNPSALAIRQHVDRKHLPLGKTLLQAMIKERSQELGKSLETAGDSLVDYIVANRAVIQRGMERLTAGEIDPNVSELLTAIRMEHTVQQAAGDAVDTQTWQEAMLAYMEVAVQFIPADRLPEYGRRLALHPVLRGLALKEGRVIQGAIANGDSED